MMELFKGFFLFSQELYFAKDKIESLNLEIKSVDFH